MEVKYYLIHGPDKSRAGRMIKEFEDGGLGLDKIQWMVYPNGHEISSELYDSVVEQNPSYSCGVYKPPRSMTKGLTSCVYKHYLCLQDIVKNKYKYSVIMEDNMKFVKGVNIPERVNTYIEQLNFMHPDWEILFDKNYGKNDCETINGTYVYRKSNEITKFGHGGTRCAVFYLLTYDCAKKLYENYIPFNNAPDWWMNDLFRKLNIKSFWADPPMVDIWDHSSTTT
jgi:GR25 family glycosyltransferase involved in LPS biosynthesis